MLFPQCIEEKLTINLSGPYVIVVLRLQSGSAHAGTRLMSCFGESYIFSNACFALMRNCILLGFVACCHDLGHDRHGYLFWGPRADFEANGSMQTIYLVFSEPLLQKSLTTFRLGGFASQCAHIKCRAWQSDL